MDQENKSLENNIPENAIYGRSAFLVQSDKRGVSVLPVVVDKENNVKHIPGIPALFPNLEYALLQIDELRSLVIKHFENLNKQE